MKQIKNFFALCTFIFTLGYSFSVEAVEIGSYYYAYI